MTPVSRRTFLGAAAAGAAIATPAGQALGRAPAPLPGLPDPKASGLDHIIVLCMENRSYDHYLGWHKGGDGKQAGLKYKDSAGAVHLTHHLADTWTGCGFSDPGHGYGAGRVQLNGGKCDGFIKDGSGNDEYALGYYVENDLECYGPLVRNFTTFDRYFCSILTQTYPNRFYTHSAATDRLSNNFDQSSLPTIWDQLDEAGVSSTYYFSDLPFLGLWYTKYLPFGQPSEQFFVDVAAGTLPQYSYIDPFFLGASNGGSNDDHPHADIRRGQAFVSRIVNALMDSDIWEKCAFVVTYDEWGGFFDHVRPPRLPDDHARAVSAPDDHSQAGFRVPTIAVSPFARRGYVGHNVYDHTSILKMVEWRFGLKPMTKRDAAARNLAETFNFAKPDFSRPTIPAVTDPLYTNLCLEELPGLPTPGMLNSEDLWGEYATSPLLKHWDLG